MGTRIVLAGIGAGTTFLNTLYVQNEVPQADWLALATKADNDWVRKVNVFQGQNVTWTSATINYTRTDGPPSQSFPLNRPGAVAGILPMQVAYVVKVQTGLAGKGNNGRWFISGLGTGQNIDGRPANSSLNTWATQNAAILAAWSASNPLGGPLCLYARQRDLLIPITNLIVSTVFGTLRSRKFGRGI